MKAHRALSRGRKDPNPPPVEEEEPSDDDEEEVDTRVAGKAHAKSCKVTGVERKASLALPSHDFTIESFDKKGVKRRVGGDSFIVSIRGTNKVRARVTDRQNGTYIVKWNASRRAYQWDASTIQSLLGGASSTSIVSYTTGTFGSPCRRFGRGGERR